MQRIPTLLQKLTELSHHPEQRSVIEIDLMLDYTRVLYADLLDWRGKMAPPTPPPPAAPEPTLAEMTAAMEQEPEVIPQPEPAAAPPQTPAPAAPTPRPEPAAPPVAPQALPSRPQYEAPESQQPPARTAPIPPAPEKPGPAPVPLPAARPPRRPIQELIGINDKYQFISVLFSNDKIAYDQLLQRISAMDSEKEAIEWLRQQHWDRDNPATMTFYEIVGQYFAGK